MSQNIIQPSLSAGELSTHLFGRVDLAKYHVGAARMVNAYVDYRGGSSNRPGTAWVGQGRNSTENIRLIPFQFSVEQSYILEFSHLRMRVIKDGGYVLEPSKVISGISQANPGVVTATSHGFIEGDTVFISDVVGMTEVNNRFYRATNVTTHSFQLRRMNVNPNTTPSSDNIDTTGYGLYTSGGTVARVFTLTTPYVGEDLFDIGFTQNADVMTLTHPGYQSRDLTRTDHHVWTLVEVSFASTTPTPTGLVISTTNGGSRIWYYRITAIGENGEESLPSKPARIANHSAGTITITWNVVPGAAGYNIYRSPKASSVTGFGSTNDSDSVSRYGFVDFVQGTFFVDQITGDFPEVREDRTITPPLNRNPFAVKPIEFVTVNAGGTGHNSNTSVTVNDSTGTGAIVRPVIKAGVIIDVVVESGGENYTNPSFSISPGSGANLTATLGEEDGTWPGAVAYFQQRRAFGGTLNSPDGFWLTKPGYIKNMDVSNPVKDDDAISAAIASQQVNNIVSMVPMPGGLVILTGGGAWQISGGGSINEPVTPANAVATPQSYNGAANIPPIVINNNILFVQRERSVVRNLQYDFFANIYTGTDVTVLSNHLLFGREIIDWTFAEEPFKVVWMVRNDGWLLSLTYLREQEVIGWARHYTQGRFKSCATVVEDDEAVTYYVVERVVDGLRLKYIERAASRHFHDEPDNYIGVDGGWFLDSAVRTALVYPAADLQVASASGIGVTCVANMPVFASGDVGKVMRLPGGGRGTVSAFVNTTTVRVDIDREIPWDSVDENGVPELARQGEWSMTTKFSTLGDLHHLEGLTISLLGDGLPLDPQVVTAGSVPLELNGETYPVSFVVGGLSYTSQIQTLPLDVGDPTVQGKRKKVSALTLRTADTMRIKAGSTFEEARLFKFQGRPDGNNKMVSQDMRIIMDPNWQVEGQLCIEQSNPLPMTVLAIIPELTVGDTSK